MDPPYRMEQALTSERGNPMEATMEVTSFQTDAVMSLLLIFFRPYKIESIQGGFHWCLPGI